MSVIRVTWSNYLICTSSQHHPPLTTFLIYNSVLKTSAWCCFQKKNNSKARSFNKVAPTPCIPHLPIYLYIRYLREPHALPRHIPTFHLHIRLLYPVLWTSIPLSALLASESIYARFRLHGRICAHCAVISGAAGRGGGEGGGGVEAERSGARRDTTHGPTPPALSMYVQDVAHADQGCEHV